MSHILIAVRAAYGAVLLVGSERLLSRLSRAPVDAGARAVARILGARELLQAELTRRHPTRAVLRAGAGIDAVHAVTMVALAAADPGRRTLATQNAVTAGALALAGVAAATSPRPGAPAPARATDAA